MSEFGADRPGSKRDKFVVAETWSEQTVGVPYDQFVTELNTGFNPLTAFIDVESRIGTGIQNMLDLSGIQQDLLDPVLGLVGSLGALFTS